MAKTRPPGLSRSTRIPASTSSAPTTRRRRSCPAPTTPRSISSARDEERRAEGEHTAARRAQAAPVTTPRTVSRSRLGGGHRRTGRAGGDREGPATTACRDVAEEAVHRSAHPRGSATAGTTTAKAARSRRGPRRARPTRSASRRVRPSGATPGIATLAHQPRHALALAPDHDERPRPGGRARRRSSPAHRRRARRPEPDVLQSIDRPRDVGDARVR